MTEHTFAPCQSEFRCSRKGSWKPKYARWMCRECITKLEARAARDAIRQLQQHYRDTSSYTLREP